METNLAFRVYSIELPLKQFQSGVIPGNVTQTHKFNDPANIKVAEVLAQPLGEFLQSWLLSSLFFVLECTRQWKGLEE